MVAAMSVAVKDFYLAIGARISIRTVTRVAAFARVLAGCAVRAWLVVRTEVEIYNLNKRQTVNQ